MESDPIVSIRDNCADMSGCPLSTCTTTCLLDQAALDWLTEHHSSDWYIGDATQAEWDAAYEHAVTGLLPQKGNVDA